MSKIIYALSGQGRGHTSRVMAISATLRERGHEVLLCCGGTARDIMESRGERVLPVPALRQVMRGNEVQHGRTLLCNLKHIVSIPRIVSDLAERFRAERADLLITDFEAFSPRAAKKIGLPVVSFNHQQVVTETRYHLPMRDRPAAAVTKLAIGLIAPKKPEHILMTSFFFPPLLHPDRATLVPPIIRPVVQQLAPSEGDRVLVYYNQTEGADFVLDALRQVDAPFVVYNFPEPERPEEYPNLTFRTPSVEGFLHDLAACRAVVCTAGFTLMSESLFLGKPLLVVPNRGIFEQTINAMFLEREGLGEAVFNRPLRADDVRGFLSRCDLYRARMQGRKACGNADAVDAIEAMLASRTNGYARQDDAPPLQKVNAELAA